MVIEQRHGSVDELSSYLKVKISSNEERLSNYAAKETSNIYGILLNSEIGAIIKWKKWIEKRIQSEKRSPLFVDDIRNALLDLDVIFWEKATEINIENPIKKLHHRIWFGSFLPESYSDFLLNFKKKNLHFKLILWTDFNTLTAEECGCFRAFCNKNNITLNNIREHTHLINYDLITEELDEIKREPQNSGVHCARASDLSRVAILIDQGGLYSDTDTDTQEKLPEIDLPLGFVIKRTVGSNPIEAKGLNSSALLYDFIASHPNNEILLLAAKISQLDYAVYHESNDVLWRTSKIDHIQESSTIRLTGTAIFCALNYLLIHNQLPKEKISSLFFDSEHYMVSYYHKSWLKHLNQFIDEIINSSDESRNAEFQSLLNFLKEIDEARESSFPTKRVKSSLNHFRLNSFFNTEDSKNSNSNFINDNNDRANGECTMIDIKKPHSFYFVRHGQTDWGPEDILQGPRDLPLNNRGIEQAKNAGLILSKLVSDESNAKMVSSSLRRAVDTAMEINKSTGIPICSEEDGFRERYYGDYRLVSDKLGTPGDVETIEAFRERVSQTLDRIFLEHHRASPLIIVSHQKVFEYLADLLANRQENLPQGGIGYFRRNQDETWQLDILDKIESAENIHTTLDGVMGI